jgi:hypothetical protein
VLIDEGIIAPLKQFHACIIINKQERWIAKATTDPNLEQAAVQIATVVKAERPANHPTLKDLIHNDVDKTTEELCRRVQSLKAKLMAKNGMGDDKRSKTKSKTGTVAPPSKKPMNKKTKATPKKTPTKSKPPSPIASNSASNATAKKQKGVPSKNKSPGKKQGKPTTTRK